MLEYKWCLRHASWNPSIYESDIISSLIEEMAPIAMSTVEQLKASLSNTASLVTPDSEAYEQSIKRWSETGERRAVRYSIFTKPC